jgi:hypothetical protein
VRRGVGDVVAAEVDPAAARVVEPVDRAERRRLAGAVRAEQRDDLTLAHLECDALKRVDRAVVRVDPVEREDDAVALRLVHEATAAFPR